MVLADNNMIYSIPYNAPQILKINPYEDEISFFDDILKYKS